MRLLAASLVLFPHLTHIGNHCGANRVGWYGTLGASDAVQCASPCRSNIMM
ncbi:hypothetical protein BIFGAL_02803 [Bifidobacterium gallicum DSM 20093 = LMG 11596]|uniref:Uncharacterized protein n=1 Tax=Bifidobacterium gallicum DSM 20093 = LMG 11596 TaxID=561180 RepID=D1NSP4_9BIFI|nr:hypothetical protein BIFGAL_02803 [Bifidobacterium gallicum DSM 20093 = LMG 11596]